MQGDNSEMKAKMARVREDNLPVTITNFPFWIIQMIYNIFYTERKTKTESLNSLWILNLMQWDLEYNWQQQTKELYYRPIFHFYMK